MQSSKDQPPVKTGDILGGKYRVEKILGVGGMGVVVAARHVELDTYVALKFLLPEALDPESVQRFSREARAMVRLRSPHVARVFDVGKLDSGAPYMVMELLVGQDLGELLDRSGVPLPMWDAVDYVLQACEGIAEAHSLGIVHRDLKPRNIFLTRHTDGRVLVKVLDFGLAKSVTTMGAAERALTRTSAIMGSPMYMSPEQMRASREVDARTDIWSLGVCLYELLTHVSPFDAATIPELCALVLTEAPRPPEAIRPDIPSGLSAAIMRCLEKDPAKRFADIGELAHALTPFARWSPDSAARASSPLDARPQRALDLEAPPLRGPIAVAQTGTEVSVDATRDRSRGWTIGAVAGAAIVVVAGASVALFVARRSDGTVAAPSAGSTATPPSVLSSSEGVSAVADPAPAWALSASPPATASATVSGSVGARPRPPPKAAAPAKPPPPKPEPITPPAPPITTAF
jgi:eukaryotic-like serine/threonine-protein kinase